MYIDLRVVGREVLYTHKSQSLNDIIHHRVGFQKMIVVFLFILENEEFWIFYLILYYNKAQLSANKNAEWIII